MSMQLIISFTFSLEELRTVRWIWRFPESCQKGKLRLSSQEALYYTGDTQEWLNTS